MANALQLSGAQPKKPSRKAPLYQGARWATGLYTNRSAIRDAASSRLEEKFYGPRGDAFLGGENLENTQRLTVARRPGHSVYNNQTWDSPDSFYEFRRFSSDQEQITVMVDQSDALYDGTGPDTKIAIWQKQSGAGQSYMQSVGNSLYWGDGKSDKKWLTTLQDRIPYVRSPYPLSQNPYNFIPYNLSTFIVDPNGNAEQLIGTILQLQNFYILNNVVVFTLKTDVDGILLPEVYEVLSPGLAIFFPVETQLAQVLGETQGITLTVQNLVGGVLSSSVYSGGAGYAIGNQFQLNQTNPAGGLGSLFQVTAVGNAVGSGYVTASNVPTTTSGSGSGATINVVASHGALVSATVSGGGVSYNIGDYIYPTQANAIGGVFKVATLSGSAIATLSLATGSVTSFSTIETGSGYYTAENIPTTTLSGSGIGLTLDITDDETAFSATVVYGGSTITTATLDDPGTGYSVGDILTPVQSAAPQAAGGELEVVGLTGGVETLNMLSGGPPVGAYTAGAATYTTSGSGSGATVTISTVSGGAVTGVTIGGGGGTNFVVGDLLYLTQGAVHGAILSVATLSGSSIATVNITQGNYTPYTVASNVPTTTSGSGTGLTMDILSVSSGSITGWDVHTAGTGYAFFGFESGDLVYPVQSTASGASFEVAELTGTAIASLSPVTVPGNGYPFFTTLPTTGGTGTGATVQITYQRIVPPLPASPYFTYNMEIIDGGNGYTVGDVITPTFTGASGAAGTAATLTSTPGPISALVVVDPGTGYITETGVPTTGGTGTGATVNLVVSSGGYYPVTSVSDNVTVYSGGNPISDSRANSAVMWGSFGDETIDGSALWINRGQVVDNGLVFNWGLAGGTSAPAVSVSNATGSWAPNTYYNRWQFIIVTVSGSKYLMRLITAGKSQNTTPSWNVTTVGQNTQDGTAVWQYIANDGDTTFTWADETQYSIGHIIEDTPSSTSCVYQLQPYTGIMTQGSNFPVYCWQCGSQSGSDVGAAGEWNPSGSNVPMNQNGTQSLSTANFSGTMNSLFLSANRTGTGTPLETSPIAGDGTVSSATPIQLFPASINLSLLMQPSFVIPAAGIYTFTVTHMNAWFWGIGSGSIEVNVISVSEQSGTLTIICDKNIEALLSEGVNLTFEDLENATWLNGVTVSVASTSGNTFTALYSHSNYGPTLDTGIAKSGNTLVPSVISGPMNWDIPGSLPNVYNFSTGTPVEGYPIVAANYVATGTLMYTDTVQLSFPAAGVYPSAIYQGVWYHKVPTATPTIDLPQYTNPTTSPVLPDISFSFSMVYTPPNSTTNYNIMPEGIACSSADAPTFPDWPADLADIQAITPAYPSVTETSGNYTWWNIGPTSTFGWNPAVEMSTALFIVDPNSNEEIPYEAGVSGTTEPTFSTTLYGVTADVPNLVWMNNGPAGSSPVGTLTTTQGGWQYVVSLAGTLDDTVSNASPASIVTGSFFASTGVFVSGGLPAVIDPQADYVAIFRTDDGGATFYLIPSPASGNGNTVFTLPLAQYLAEGFTDTTPDSGLDTLLQAPVNQQNSVPPKGAINLAFNFGRLFWSVGNVVNWSSGPNTPIGNGYDAFSPINYANFPSLVTRIVPLNIGTLIFTVSDIYIIAGNGTTSNPFDPQPLETKVGLLSYNALTINGSIPYFMTADQQVVELHVGAGLSHIGFPIADQFVQTGWSPSTSYLAWHVNGSNDQCLFVADGSTGWFRMSPTAAPEAPGLTWSIKANLVGGCKAVQSIETTPGNVQLLVGPLESGPILYRDYSTNTDNGETYPANFELGSIVMAHPGELAGVEFITTECGREEGALPISLGVRMGEIGGDFEDLVFWDTDPPQLPPSETLYAQRFYIAQTKFPAQARHLQIYGEFQETDSADELLTLTVYGGYSAED